jgi:hypothetical protein
MVILAMIASRGVAELYWQGFARGTAGKRRAGGLEAMSGRFSENFRNFNAILAESSTEAGCGAGRRRFLNPLS